MNSLKKLNSLVFSEHEFHRVVCKYEIHKSSSSLDELYEKIYRLFDKKLIDKISSNADETNILLNKFHFSYLTYYDSNYPSLLKEIHDPPIILFYRGDSSILKLTYTGIVGTRKPSPLSLSATSSIVNLLASRSHSGIISGLANGIDREAMISSIQKKVPVIGVMGTGFDKEYPYSNKDLYGLMKNSSDTLLLTEVKPGEKIGKWSFPKRNRIITGIAESLILMEAPLESGAISSASHAISQNRDILVFDDESLKFNQGGRKLIEEGAKCLTKKDISENSKIVHLSDILPDAPEYISKSIAFLSKLELEGKVKDRGGGYFEFFE
jgi:DNA processing protein